MSASRSSKSPECSSKSPIKSVEGSSSVMNETSRSAKELSSAKENVVWGSTEHLSARRFKNTQRGKRFNLIVGEEKGYTSESGNEMEDRDNSFYDSRLVPADKKLLADWQWKIKKIKQQEFPKEYLEIRDEWLKNADIYRQRKDTLNANIKYVQLNYPKKIL